jgi:hypothetical protein
MKNLMFLLLVVILFSGCAKDGETGPAGQDGNANVLVEIISVFVEDWEIQNGVYHAQVSSELLSDDIVENGTVNLFMDAGPGVWLALPEEKFGFAYDNSTLYLFGKIEPTTTIVLKLVAISGMQK